jgi:hypothetical protein
LNEREGSKAREKGPKKARMGVPKQLQISENIHEGFRDDVPKIRDFSGLFRSVFSTLD